MNPPTRPEPRPRGERLIGLFLLGAAAFSPPLLRIFGQDTAPLGWPLLYLYIFGAWAGLILLVAFLVERRAPRAASAPEADEP